MDTLTQFRTLFSKEQKYLFVELYKNVGNVAKKDLDPLFQCVGMSFYHFNYLHVELTDFDLFVEYKLLSHIAYTIGGNDSTIFYYKMTFKGHWIGYLHNPPYIPFDSTIL